MDGCCSTPNGEINLPSRDRKVGFLFQNYALFPHLTVAQNVAFGLNTGKNRTGKDRVNRVVTQSMIDRQLAAMDLTELADRYPHQTFWRATTASGSGQGLGEPARNPVA